MPHAPGIVRVVQVVLAVAVATLIDVGGTHADSPFEGERSEWHEGFVRFDYLLDAETLDITPFKRPEREGFGVQDPPAGKRRCIVVVPKQAAEGNPWSWQACYWNHEPQTEVELLRRGYHVAYISANAVLRPDKTWEAFYDFLTAKHGLSPRPAFVGMSRGGEYAYTWSTQHPDKVSCIYADNPATNAEVLAKLGDLARADIPLLHVCGTIDPLLGRASNPIETIYRQFGGRISVILKEGVGHHPHSLRNPKPIADFITQSFRETRRETPAFVTGRVLRNVLTSPAATFEEDPVEKTYLTRRGPFFTAAYDRYSFTLDDVEGAIQVILPIDRSAGGPWITRTDPSKENVAGKPWVYRADLPTEDSAVDLALLSNGIAIVTGPVPYNADGPHLEHWNKVYEHLTSHGFSRKAILAGTGGAAGEAYAWGIANPDKVACLYAENPLLKCTMTKSQPLDNLAPLAMARVPILHACGSLDPLIDSQTRVAERKYRELGGELTVLVTNGVAHDPSTPSDVTAAVKFIIFWIIPPNPGPSRR